MKLINGERGSGKTDGLIFTAAATGARIVTPTRNMALFIEKRAKERGIEILQPVSAAEYFSGNYGPHEIRGGLGNRVLERNCGTPILIDEADNCNGVSIIEAALSSYFGGVQVIAATINAKQIKTLFPEAAKAAGQIEKGEKPKLPETHG